MSTESLLIEIGTEELPPTSAKKLSDAFVEAVSSQLIEAGFSIGTVTPHVTPRRLAMVINDVSNKQPDQVVERKGPAIAAAYDDDGAPTKAALGFANSCGVEMKDLDTLESDKGAYLFYKSTVPGKQLTLALPSFIEQALSKLPIPKPMRWGSNDAEFVRPIHWVIVMYGSAVVDCTIKNIVSSNISYGHRFHAPQAITISHPDKYSTLLKKSKVISDFNERKSTIENLLSECASKHNAVLNYNDALLEEVTNLVEWPAIIVGEFSKDFLNIPQEALVVTMQDAQRYFPMFSQTDNELLPLFITIANIESSNPDTIKRGNERVIKPRFDDANFFWNRDKQQTLDERTKNLSGILFEKQLGSLLDKSKRITQLSDALCKQLGVEAKYPSRAASLCKSDLLTDMVNEFPKLQGIMGRYYALHDNEPNDVAMAIEEHYQPIQSGGAIPDSTAGKIVAICDRIDTLVGIFATGKKPTGVKDPYALRRAALGLIRISIEGELDFDLGKLLQVSASLLKDKLDASAAADEVLEFITDRLRGYFLDLGIAADTFEAVRNVQPTHLIDFADRIQAVQQFRDLPESSSLAAANKRIRNILKKAETVNLSVNESLLSVEAENNLIKQINAMTKKVSPKFEQRKYSEALFDLSALRPSIDQYFEDVMVMDEDEDVRNNRIATLAQVNKLFSTVADISLLQS